ncbi:UNVERIFIED_CONTAM: hypothetical protein HDU68_011730 [Siphonaria sp. JEL0065]|nr:hypothetical protein HDU68_011730 [Siphonaria sp. JEL0065]
MLLALYILAMSVFAAPLSVSLGAGASAAVALSASFTGGVIGVSISAGAAASAAAASASVSVSASLSAHVVTSINPNLMVEMGPNIVPTTTLGGPSVSLPTVAIPGNIVNNPGPIMVNGVNLYLVWYGDHTNQTKKTIRNFVSGLGSSKWWTLTKAYTDNGGKRPTNSIRIAKEYHDNYSQGKYVTQSQSIIQSAIVKGKWPVDSNGIYFLLLAVDVDEAYSNTQGLCKQYCGYHSTSNIKWGLIGNGQRCPCDPTNGCSRGCIQTLYRTHYTNPTYSINGNQAADSMINIMAHEITETVTDFFFGTWMDRNGWENADKCNQIFLDTKKKGGVPYNVDFGKYGKYLIQSNWDPVNQKCALAYVAPPKTGSGVTRTTATLSVKESNQ